MYRREEPPAPGRKTGHGAGRMSRTRRFLGGLGCGLFNQVLIMVVGLWLTSFLLGRVGRHDYGLWLVATQVMSYLMLLDLGVVGLLPRETAYATGRAGGVAAASAELPALVGHTFKVILCQLPVVAAAAAFVAWRFLIPPEWAPCVRPWAWPSPPSCATRSRPSARSADGSPGSAVACA